MPNANQRDPSATLQRCRAKINEVDEIRHNRPAMGGLPNNSACHRFAPKGHMYSTWEFSYCMHPCVRLLGNCMHFLGADLTKPVCSTHRLCAAQSEEGVHNSSFVGPPTAPWQLGTFMSFTGPYHLPQGECHKNPSLHLNLITIYNDLYKEVGASLRRGAACRNPRTLPKPIAFLLFFSILQFKFMMPGTKE